MIALPIALVLFGYWVMYSGIKRTSMLDAYRCAPQQRQTATPQGGPGSISVTPVPGGPTLGVSLDCRQRPGDTRIPVPGASSYFLWRPVGSGILGQVNGQLIGPC